MFAVQGIYDDGIVRIDAPVPVKNKYDVVVTFIKPVEPVKPAENDTDQERKLAALNRITGVLSTNAMTLEEARRTRQTAF